MKGKKVNDRSKMEKISEKGGGEHKVKPEGEEGEGAADGGQTHREEAVSRIIQVVQV